MDIVAFETAEFCLHFLLGELLSLIQGGSAPMPSLHTDKALSLVALGDLTKRTVLSLPPSRLIRRFYPSGAYASSTRASDQAVVISEPSQALLSGQLRISPCAGFKSRVICACGPFPNPQLCTQDVSCSFLPSLNPARFLTLRDDSSIYIINNCCQN